MNAYDLLREVEHAGYRLRVVDDVLKVRPFVPVEVLDRIRPYREEMKTIVRLREQRKVVPIRDQCPNCQCALPWTWDRCPKCGHNRHVQCVACAHWAGVCELGRTPSHPELRVTICGLYREKK